MMVTESTMYWLTRLTSLKEGTIGLGIGIMVLFGILGVILLLEGHESYKKWCILSVLILILGGLTVFGSIFIPTTKEMCAIKAIPVIVNNEEVQELPNKVVELANEWIDELKPTTETE